MNNEDFTVLVSGGGRCCWVSICTVWPSYSRWLSKYTNKSASDFVLSLNIPPWKLFGWFRRPQLGATGDWQLHHDNTPTHISHLVQSFLAKHQITQVTQPSYSPDLQLLAFPKTKITFEREEISDCWWDSENTIGQLTANGRTVWGPKVPTLKRLRHHCPVCNISCILCILQWVSLFFLLHGWILSEQTSYILSAYTQNLMHSKHLCILCNE